MAIDRLLLLDTETSGLDDSAACIEVAVSLYDVPRAAVVRSFASLIRAESNAAEAVNRIPPALLAEADEPAAVWSRVAAVAKGAQAIVAHGAAFDARFVPASVVAGRPWICSMEDIEWPRPQGTRAALTKLALAHDLGVSHAHRAAVDVDLLGRLFTRAAEMGADLQAMLARAMRPKALFVVARSDFDADRNALAKAAGFAWDSLVPRAWARRMPAEDAAALPFAVREIVEREPDAGECPKSAGVAA